MLSPMVNEIAFEVVNWEAEAENSKSAKQKFINNPDQHERLNVEKLD